MNSTNKSEACIRFTFQPRYRVLDLSGTWDFAIDYYVVLSNNKNDLNHGFALKISTHESILDLPFALKQGYLVCRDLDQDGAALDFDDLDLDSEPRPHQCVIVPKRTSPGGWYKSCIKIATTVEPFGQIAAHFTPLHRYKLEVTEAGLASSIKWCRAVQETFDKSSSFEDPLTFDPSQSDDINVSWDKCRTGHAEFKALLYLRRPPHIQVTLHANTPLNLREHEDLCFSVEILNRSDRAVTVLSRGQHRYVSTLDLLYQAEGSCVHNRITAAGEKLDRESFSLRNTKTETELIIHKEPVCTLTRRSDKPTHRPRFTTLQPNVPLIKYTSVRSLLPRRVDLEVGEEYELSIPPMGAEWFWGTIDEVFGSEEGQARLPWDPLETPPVLLGSENKITFKVVS